MVTPQQIIENLFPHLNITSKRLYVQITTGIWKGYMYLMNFKSYHGFEKKTRLQSYHDVLVNDWNTLCSQYTLLNRHSTPSTNIERLVPRFSRGRSWPKFTGPDPGFSYIWFFRKVNWTQVYLYVEFLFNASLCF